MRLLPGRIPVAPVSYPPVAIGLHDRFPLPVEFCGTMPFSATGIATGSPRVPHTYCRFLRELPWSRFLNSKERCEFRSLAGL